MYLQKPYIKVFKLGSNFGMRVHPIEKIEKMHNGQDIRMPLGTELFAPLKGIARCYENKSAGKFIVIDSRTEQGTRVQFIFCHLSKFLIKFEQVVNAWEKIALSGNTGASTGAHLHFGVKIFDNKKNDFVFVDPIKYFNFGV